MQLSLLTTDINDLSNKHKSILCLINFNKIKGLLSLQWFKFVLSKKDSKSIQIWIKEWILKN
jgi:hypothetical protein